MRAGFQLVTASPAVIAAEQDQAHRASVRGLVTGVVTCVLGVAATAYTFTTHSFGGYVVVCYGAIIGGIALAGRSANRLLDLRRERRLRPFP